MTAFCLRKHFINAASAAAVCTMQSAAATVLLYVDALPTLVVQACHMSHAIRTVATS